MMSRINLAQARFEREFQRYSLAREDCRQFCVRLLVLVCPDDRVCESSRTYVYTESFALR